jgi:hypothetical protein
MRPSRSWRNPFITAITMMRVATPSAMPMREMIEMTETNASFRFGRK